MAAAGARAGGGTAGLPNVHLHSAVGPTECRAAPVHPSNKNQEIA
jgi:hypothetical protein